jgi:hypothetical protein
VLKKLGYFQKVLYFRKGRTTSAWNVPKDGKHHRQSFSALDFIHAYLYVRNAPSKRVDKGAADYLSRNPEYWNEPTEEMTTIDQDIDILHGEAHKDVRIELYSCRC